MMLVDEIAQIIRINERNIGASQTAQLIMNLLSDKGYGTLVPANQLVGFKIYFKPIDDTKPMYLI